MQSHSYRISKEDWLGSVWWTLAAFVGIVLCARILGSSEILPITGPSGYVEDIVIEEKERAARDPDDVDLLFVGDSSCLMGFSARAFEELMPRTRVYNLGTLSTLGLEKFGAFSGRFLKNAPGVQTVVLLISPEMVRSGSAKPAAARALPPEFEERMRALQADNRRVDAELKKDRINDIARWLVLPLIRTQLVARVFEKPLAGSFGLTYGFPQGLREYIRREKGSVADPTVLERKTTPTRRMSGGDVFISDAFKAQCESLRKQLPRGVRLLAGLTPVSQAEHGADYRAEFQETLLILRDYLAADGVLTNLPATLPDRFFSTSTHLSPAGAREYTHALARALRGEAQIIAAHKREHDDQKNAQGGASGLGSQRGESKGSP
jgi:hypothetical protein